VTDFYNVEIFLISPLPVTGTGTIGLLKSVCLSVLLSRFLCPVHISYSSRPNSL